MALSPYIPRSSRDRMHPDEREPMTYIDTVTSSESELTGQEALDHLQETHPEWKPYIDQLILDRPDRGDQPIGDYLDEIQDLANDAGDDSVDTSTVELDEVHYGHLFIEELADISIPAEADTHIVISTYGVTLLDNIYAPGLDGYIHLDLRDFVYENTDIFLPDPIPETGFENYEEQEDSGLLLDITATQGSSTSIYQLWVNAFRRAAVDTISDIDRIDIPSDALIPVSLYREMDLDNADYEIFFVTAGRKLRILTGSVADGDGYLICSAVPVSHLPYRPREPFYLECRIEVNKTLDDDTQEWIPEYKTVRTPVYRVVTAPKHQYFFLNDYGNYDLIPMGGALTLAPEYEIENAFHTRSVERAKATMRQLYTQNSGALTKTAAQVLAQLLLSRAIYYYVPGSEPRRIVVESPSVQISSNQSINTVSFSWRAAEQ